MADYYQIRIHGIFESAHYLYDYHGEGKNEALHGHTFEVELFINSYKLKNGISVDFLKVREKFDSLMLDLDHICLNKIIPFSEINPTAENIGKYIYNTLKEFLLTGAYIHEVRVWEGPKNFASYFPDNQ